MAEPTCVMHAFSYPSGISSEAQEENPIYDIEESVSLGRFMSESLSWEKWSSFSRNRYVEEAEMYSRPGSVKQKKAYFEAHFKKMAELKAAALLEQANSTQPKNGDEIDDHVDLHVEGSDPSSPLSTLDQQWIEKEDVSSVSVSSCNEEKLNDGDDQLRSEGITVTDQVNCNEDEFKDVFMVVEEQNPSTDMKYDLAAQDEFEEHFMDFEGQNSSTEMECDLAKVQDDFEEHFIYFEGQNPSIEMECDIAEVKDELEEHFMDFEGQNPSTEMEYVLTKAHASCLEVDVFHECVVVEKEDGDSCFVADHIEDDKDAEEDDPTILSLTIMEGIEQAAQVEPTEERLVDADKQNTSTEMDSVLVKRDDSRLEVNFGTSSLDSVLNIAISEIISDLCRTATSTRSKPNLLSSAFIPSTPIGKKNPKLSPYMPPIESKTTSHASSSSPAKSVAQPAAVHPGKENTFTPKGRKSWIDDPEKKRTPLRMSINRELNRLISPVIKKIGSSSKASNKDCSTPLKTSAKASIDGMKNNPPETPQSGKRRARALFDSSSGCGGTKAAGSRWQFLSTEASKSPAGGKNKTSSPIIPKSFCLSSSRAPRRKEKLEEKFNANATESIQPQSKLKEKPKEHVNLRQSFCFGAKLSSESFREREKSKADNCKTPNKGRSRLQNMTSLPPQKPKPKGITKTVKPKKGEFGSSDASTE